MFFLMFYMVLLYLNMIYRSLSYHYYTHSILSILNSYIRHAMQRRVGRVFGIQYNFSQDKSEHKCVSSLQIENTTKGKKIIRGVSNEAFPSRVNISRS